MEEYINKEMIKQLMIPENLKKFKESQEEAKEISEQIKKSLVVDPRILRQPFTI